MLEQLLRGGSDDGYGQAADERAGAWSALVGVAANASLASGTQIELADLAVGIPRPDMPSEPFGPPTAWQIFEKNRYPFLTGAKTITL